MSSSVIGLIGNIGANQTGPGREVLAKLEADAGLMGVKSAKAGLEDMKLLFDYLEVYGSLDKVS